MMKKEFNLDRIAQEISSIEEVEDRIILEGFLRTDVDFWTIGGLVQETGFARSEVRDVLRRHPGLVRSPFVPNRDGQQLFTLRDKPRSWRERLVEFGYMLGGPSFWTPLEISEVYHYKVLK